MQGTFSHCPLETDKETQTPFAKARVTFQENFRNNIYLELSKGPLHHHVALINDSPYQDKA